MDVLHLLSFDLVCLSVAKFGMGGGGGKDLGVVLPIILCTCVIVSAPQMALLPRRLMHSVLRLSLQASSFQNTSNMPHPNFCQSRRELHDSVSPPLLN